MSVFETFLICVIPNFESLVTFADAASGQALWDKAGLLCDDLKLFAVAVNIIRYYQELFAADDCKCVFEFCLSG